MKKDNRAATRVLSPCPFCGGMDVGLTYNENSCSIKCFNTACQARGYGSRWEADAVRRWNRRAVVINPPRFVTDEDMHVRSMLYSPTQPMEYMQRPNRFIGKAPTEHDPFVAATEED